MTSYFHITGHRYLKYETDDEIVSLIVFTFIPFVNILIMYSLLLPYNTTTKAGAKQFGKKLYNYLPFLPVFLLLLLFFI